MVSIIRDVMILREALTSYVTCSIIREVVFLVRERSIEDQLALLPEHLESSREVARARPIHRRRLVFLAHRKLG